MQPYLDVIGVTAGAAKGDLCLLGLGLALSSYRGPIC